MDFATEPALHKNKKRATRVSGQAKLADMRGEGFSACEDYRTRQPSSLSVAPT